MMRRILSLLLVLGLGIAGAGAEPIFRHGGHPTGGGGGSSQACDSGGSGVCAQFQAGQTFITWPDLLATGVTDYTKRYRLYSSTSPITSGNYTAATLQGSYILPNSGQLVAGDPASSTTLPYTQSYKQDATKAMAKLSDLGTSLSAYTGLFVHTALGTATMYFAVVSTDASDANPAFLGSVGPIAESVATPAAIKWAASGARGQSYGNITLATSNAPTVLSLHQSNATGGCTVIDCIYGDYWEYFVPAADGAYFYDGLQMNWGVNQDHAQNYPGQANTLQIEPRDAVWNALGTGSLETYHQGLGMTPNPLVGPANRKYSGKATAYAAFLNWAIGHYGLDPNQLHCEGKSMGGWGSANTCMRMTSPRISAVWMGMPRWRMDIDGSSSTWPGGTWTTGMPFTATVAAAPSTLGSTASSVLTGDGAQWGGTGGYVDMPSFISASPGTDLPVAIWMTSKSDTFSFFSTHLSALTAFQAAHRGHSFVWFEGLHDTGFPARSRIDCDWVVTSTISATADCYHKADFKLNVPYPAFDHSSIDDNPGTGAAFASGTYAGSGLLDGDWVGGVNIGFHWSVTSDTSGGIAFTVSNSYMGNSPTTLPATTLTGSMASSGSGSVGLTSTSGFLTANAAGNEYFLIGTGATAEAVQATWTGTTLNFTSRGLFGSTAHAHSAGDPIIQLVSEPTGPNGGPYSSMTVTATLRRLQNFHPSEGATVHCTYTPSGGSPASQDITVTNGLFPIPLLPINVGGSTDAACS